MTSNAIHSVSLAGLRAGNTVYLQKHSANLFRDERWTLLGNQILHHRSESFPFISPICVCTSLQVHVIANAQLVRCVLVRLSPNWPNTNKTAVKWKMPTRNVAAYARFTESACRRGVNAPRLLGGETVYKPDTASQHNRLSLSTGHFNFVLVRHK